MRMYAQIVMCYATGEPLHLPIASKIVGLWHCAKTYLFSCNCSALQAIRLKNWTEAHRIILKSPSPSHPMFLLLSFCLLAFYVAFSVFDFTSQTRHETTCLKWWWTNEPTNKRKKIIVVCAHKKMCFGIVAHCSNAFLCRNSNSFIRFVWSFWFVSCSIHRFLVAGSCETTFFYFSLSFSRFQNGMRNNRVEKKTSLLHVPEYKRYIKYTERERKKITRTFGNTLNMLHRTMNEFIHILCKIYKC